ncbi:hypothetical protein GCM10025789_12230 [Tessaracoccus lubricantis]|uniref:NADPH--hemoprotein reductase n=1 Tax=Tessaracoccus lubricantis TaxID=545543 RepID=A0ABP9F7T8_9ACTN
MHAQGGQRSAEAFQLLADRYQLAPLPVLDSHEMVDVAHPWGEPKRFLRVALPSTMGYRTGDHLAVLPRNPEPLVHRVAARFGLDPEATITLAAGRRGLPVGIPVSVRQLLAEFLELRFPPSALSVGRLVEHTRDDAERRELTRLAGLEREEFRRQVTAQERSVLDLLEQFPSCALPFEQYLDLLRPMRVRSYSISSSPLVSPHEADLMVSLLDEPHRAGVGTYTGVASEFLQRTEADDVLHGKVVRCQESFRLPDDASVPVILVCAGTGLAPFRAAVADRTVTPGGTLLLYFGCRHPDVDFLHRAELEAADAAGVVSLRATFSRAPQDGMRYVQHRIAREGREVWGLLERGAHVRVCGDGRHMAPDVRAAFRELRRDHAGGSEEDAVAWLHELMTSGRYVEDVWAG